MGWMGTRDSPANTGVPQAQNQTPDPNPLKAARLPREHRSPAGPASSRRASVPLPRRWASPFTQRGQGHRASPGRSFDANGQLRGRGERDVPEGGLKLRPRHSRWQDKRKASPLPPSPKEKAPFTLPIQLGRRAPSSGRHTAYHCRHSQRPPCMRAPVPRRRRSLHVP